MASFIRAAAQALVLASVGLAGCSGDGEGFLGTSFTTGALGTQATAPEVDAACVSLASRIETLRKEGVADKIEKAAAKKYKMTQADLTKADQLTKASADFQLRCSTIMPRTAASGAASPPLAAPPSGQAPKAAKAASAPAGASAPQN